MQNNNICSKKPLVYHYYDYRKYLRDLFNYIKKKNRDFSHRYVIKKAGYKSPTMLKHVMDGKRNLTIKSAACFARVFKLDDEERKYFLTLVRFSLARLPEEKEKYYKELSSFSEGKQYSLLKDTQNSALSKWWHMVIREAVQLPDAKNSAKWLSRVLLPEITEGEARDSVKLLKDIGLINKEGEKWTASDSTVTTDAEVAAVQAMNYHRQMVRLGIDAISNSPFQEREISGTTLRVAKKDVKLIKELIRDFRKNLLAVAEKSEPADQVYQFNTQFFPVVLTCRNRRLK